MLNQQDAQRLIKETGFLLLLNAPEGLELGIDNISWKTGAKFKGVKLIPYGAHLVFYSLKSEGHLFKMGFFTYFSP
jgi:A1 cistron-splicing factor AAR2